MPRAYERRRPETSVFYRIVAEQMETLFARAEEQGPGYPHHVKRELTAGLRPSLTGL